MPEFLLCPFRNFREFTRLFSDFGGSPVFSFAMAMKTVLFLATFRDNVNFPTLNRTFGACQSLLFLVQLNTSIAK